MKYSPEIVSAMVTTIYDQPTAKRKDAWKAAQWLLFARKSGWIDHSELGADSEQRWHNIEKIAARLEANGSNRPKQRLRGISCR
jgi:hypothetical protein